MALDRGKRRVCRVAWVPSTDRRDERRRSRERARLVEERGQHPSRIKWLMMAFGIRGFGRALRDWGGERIENSREAYGFALPPCLKAELNL